MADRSSEVVAEQVEEPSSTSMDYSTADPASTIGETQPAVHFSYPTFNNPEIGPSTDVEIDTSLPKVL